MDEKIDNKGESILNTIREKLSNMSISTKVKWLLVIVVMGVILVVASNYSAEKNIMSTAKDTVSNYTYYVSSLDYCARLEEKLEKVLSNIDGVSGVEVMISLDSSLELVLAESSSNDKEDLLGNNYSVDVSSPIIIDNGDKEEPLIIKEILPKVKGVLVVLSGQQSVATKLSIIQAVQSLLDINVSNIQVLSGS
ncbi:MAG: hypothetical protein E7361_02510 [Clostridiales bacterium]|nr:hypothetical protein [Clostridiales bacterium]